MSARQDLSADLAEDTLDALAATAAASADWPRFFV